MGEPQAVLNQPHAGAAAEAPPPLAATQASEIVAAVGPQEPSRRDSLRRRLLASGDIGALVLALGAAVLYSPTATTARSGLVLLVAIPLWIVLNKLLGLYDRDANAHRTSRRSTSSLDRSMPVVTWGSAATCLLAPLIRRRLDLARGQHDLPDRRAARHHAGDPHRRAGLLQSPCRVRARPHRGLRRGGHAAGRQARQASGVPRRGRRLHRRDLGHPARQPHRSAAGRSR